MKIDSSAMGGRSGFGRRPALLVIDLSAAFTKRESPLACDLDSAVASVRRILAIVRDRDRVPEANRVPVVFTTVAYGGPERVSARPLLMKVPAASICQPGSKWASIDERLERRTDEPVITKVFPSAFFNTTLISLLVGWHCDSVIVTGASTSGCVRATVVDAVSHGFQVVVPKEAVGDRFVNAHNQSLADIDLKYGDVVSEAEVIEWLSLLHSPSDA